MEITPKKAVILHINTSKTDLNKKIKNLTDSGYDVHEYDVTSNDIDYEEVKDDVCTDCDKILIMGLDLIGQGADNQDIKKKISQFLQNLKELIKRKKKKFLESILSAIKMQTNQEKTRMASVGFYAQEINEQMLKMLEENVAKVKTVQNYFSLYFCVNKDVYKDLENKLKDYNLKLAGQIQKLVDKSIIKVVDPKYFDKAGNIFIDTTGMVNEKDQINLLEMYTSKQIENKFINPDKGAQYEREIEK